MKLSIFLILLLDIFLGALANVFLKIGMTRLPSFEFSTLMKNLSKIFLNPFIILGIICFASTFPLYSFLLQKIKLAIVFPLITSLTFLLVVLLSVFFFKESLGLLQYLGIFFLAIGLWFLAR
jgi:multidrug transporter EmrE-like cation transporter